MSTLKKWLSHRYVKRAKLVIVSYVVGLFTENFVVNSVIGRQTVNELFANSRNLIIWIVTILVVAFIVYKPVIKNPNGGQPQNFPPRS